MSGPLTAASETIQVTSVVPILRMYDVAATIRFYVGYLGCSLDWQAGDGDRPVYLQVSRGAMTLHLSSHHDEEHQGRRSSWRYATSTHCTPNYTSADTRSSTRASGQVLGTSGRCSLSILLPTGSASTRPHQPGKARQQASRG